MSFNGVAERGRSRESGTITRNALGDQARGTRIFGGIGGASVAALTLFGWVTGAPFLTGLSGHSVPMVPEAALQILALGLILASNLPSLARGLPKAALFAFALAAAIYCLSCAQGAFTGTSPAYHGVFLLKGDGREWSPGRHMAPHTALALALSWIAVCLTLAPFRRAFLRTLSGALGLVVMLGGFMGLLAWAYGAPLLSSGRTAPVSMNAALALFFTGVGLLALAGRDFPPFRLFMGSGPSAQFLRATLPVVAGSSLAGKFIERQVVPPGWALRSWAEVALVFLIAASSSLLIILLSLRSFRKADRAEEERRRDAFILEKNLKRNEILNRSLSGLLATKAQEEVYPLVGEAMAALVPDAYLLISGLTPDEKSLQLRWMHGFQRLRAAARDLLGLDPMEWRGPLSAIEPEELAHYRDGRVHRMEDGLWALAMRTIPRPICKALDLLGGVGSYHYVGFAWDGRHYGGIIFAMKGAADFEDHDAVEQLAHQASIALQRLRSEETLRQKTLLWQTTFDAIKDPIYVLSLDYEILSINKAAKQASGLPTEALIGKKCHEICHGTAHPIPGCPCVRSRSTGRNETQVLEQKGRTYEESIWPIQDERGNALSFVHTVVDITEKKRAQELLAIRMRFVEYAAGHELQEILVNTLDEVCAFTGSAIGFYHFVDEQETGLTLQAWSTRTSREFCRAEGHGAHYAVEKAGVWADCLRLRAPIVHNDYVSLPERKGLPPGHAPVTRELVVPVMRDGKIVAILGVGNKAQDYGNDDVRDVAYLADVAWERVKHFRVREKLSVEQRQNEQSLQRNQKLESLGVLAGGIAHDFNNLLHGLFNLMEIAGVQIGKGDPSKAARTLEAARPVYERAKSLTRQFLTFSKGGAPVRKSLKLEGLLRHGARFSLTGSAVTARVEIPQELWPCDVDEHQVGQVLDNLIRNARHAMGEAGVIEIGASNQILDPPTGDARGRYVRVSVRDHGCGIAPGQLSRIFDPFYTTKEKGQGLGLSMVHSIVKAHGGWVDVESEPGKGSVFHVALPASLETPAPEETRGDRGTLRAGARVLILDDQDYARRVTREILEELGHRVGEADHGQAALERIEEASRAGEPFQIAILDLTIPGGMGGREAAKAIRDLDPRVYLIAASGYSEHPVMSDPAAHGFDAALFKPFKAAELREALGKAGG